MPLVGFGIWKVPKENAADACYNAIKLGYRHIDGAHDYQNSKEAGAGVQKAIEDGLVKREELFITSKLWNNYHAKPHVLEMAKFENENWGVDYLDLVSRRSTTLCATGLRRLSSRMGRMRSKTAST